MDVVRCPRLQLLDMTVPNDTNGEKNNCILNCMFTALIIPTLLSSQWE